ncbi:MAG: hypothetical protein M3506_08195 [Chloroflexota bacterium]|nr:hypothetical protein [Chloroflexota bacterium]
MSQDIIQYIRTNRGTYTNEAISRSLLDAGHEPAAVEAAWWAVEAGQNTPSPVRKSKIRRTPSFWLTLLGYPTVLIALTALADYLIGATFASQVFVVGLGIAGVTALVLVIARRRIAVAAGLAAALTLLVLVAIIAALSLAGVALV